MYAIEATNTGAAHWYIDMAHFLAWTDEASCARLFDSSDTAEAWLAQRKHSGCGVRVRLHVMVH